MATVTKGKRRKREEESRCPELPPRGENGQEGPDLISRLPDGVLGDVLTLLPTKDGARTQILSRRWRPIWRSAPLNLEAKLDHQPDVGAMLSALRSHQGPVRRFCVTLRRSYDNFPMVDSILGCSRLNNLQEFELLVDLNGFRCPPVPQSVLRFTSTLRILCIYSIREILKFPNDIACALHFPRLKQLTLKNVNISELGLHSILSRCSVLEALFLDNNRGYRRLLISSLTLRSLGVADTFGLQREGLEVIVDNAPLLEKLIPRNVKNYNMVIRVIHAPKIKALGYLSDKIATLELGSIVFQKMVPVSLSTTIRTVKILALHTGPNLDFVIDFLKLFPCVEKLYIVANGSTQGDFKNIQHCVSLEDHALHLKVIHIIRYVGDISEVNFIRFFVSNAKVLESMKFLVCRDKCDIEWIASQHRKLQLNSKAATKGVRLDFIANRRSGTFVHMKHINDLTIDDPFDTLQCECPDGFN